MNPKTPAVDMPGLKLVVRAHSLAQEAQDRIAGMPSAFYFLSLAGRVCVRGTRPRASEKIKFEVDPGSFECALASGSTHSAATPSGVLPEWRDPSSTSGDLLQLLI